MPTMCASITSLIYFLWQTLMDFSPFHCAPVHHYIIVFVQSDTVHVFLYTIMLSLCRVTLYMYFCTPLSLYRVTLYMYFCTPLSLCRVTAVELVRGKKMCEKVIQHAIAKVTIPSRTKEQQQRGVGKY